MLYYFGDSEGYWIGIALDDAGAVEYTLFSQKSIPEECLDTPPDHDEQTKRLDSFFSFQRKKAIGIWYADDALNDPASGTDDAADEKEE